MQLFFNSSEEGKFSGGFKYIDKKIVKFDNKKIQVPNISWLSLNKQKR